MYFSIIIPLYNKESYIQRAIKSVLLQTYQDFELIIVDDGSTDGSFEAASAIQDPRIHIVRQENRGVSAARNRGVSEAKYDWVAFLDADDEWLPEFLEMMNDLHTQFATCGLLASGFLKERDTGLDFCEFQKIRYTNGRIGIIDDYYTDLREIVPFCSSSFIVKKDVFYKLEAFH